MNKSNWLKDNFNNVIAAVAIVLAIAAILFMAFKPAPAVTVTAPATAHAKTNLEYQSGKPFRIVLPSIYHPVHRLMLAGFMQACEDLKVYCLPILSGDVTIDQYIANMESAVSLGSSGVVMNLGAPVIYKAGEDLVLGTGNVVAVHTPISKTDIPGLTAWVSADPTVYPKDAAKAMADKLNCKGVVAVMQSAESDTENAVGRGFSAELKRLCPSITVLPIQMEGVEPTKAAAVDAAVLAAHPEITGAFSSTGGGATSWATALKEAGKKPGDVIVISMDYTRPNLDLVKAGWVYALVAQPIYTEFYHGVELLLAHLKGETVPYENLLQAPVIFAADLDKYYHLNDVAGNK